MLKSLPRFFSTTKIFNASLLIEHTIKINTNQHQQRNDDEKRDNIGVDAQCAVIISQKKHLCRLHGDYHLPTVILSFHLSAHFWKSETFSACLCLLSLAVTKANHWNRRLFLCTWYNVGISFILCSRKEMTKNKLCIASKWLMKKLGYMKWDTTQIVRKKRKKTEIIFKHIIPWSMICYRGERAQFLQLNKQEKVKRKW